MPFGDAVRSVLRQYATFSGRARRSEYWFWSLALFGTYMVAAFVDAAIGRVGQVGILTLLVMLATFVPSLAVTFRRLHDTGRSGAWWLISLIPIVGVLVLLVFTLLDSGPNNQYGPNPKGLAYPPGAPALG